MKALWKLFAVTLLALFLVACSKVTPANFEKIQEDMTRQQVAELLGEPADVSSASLLGFSGGTATWRHGKTVITVRFVNDKVVSKQIDTAATTSAY
ncbi:putative lipoprotein [Pseudogulbenkiania sp. NH8B]|uniref:outer membrane protein assembly factor BamE domain-containing protein n=1 Tax=Pseudogulbenkiania sp. (strain NH8B) TaxID=748280 RepID=UPI0002279E7D|nr:outer membrane protein assembly factor BamE [Pseudogulbenkiania sp. NH8B]BAK77135.1 putative lipoprotein [Pseudogulbenkiania sp. NH8B]